MTAPDDPFRAPAEPYRPPVDTTAPSYGPFPGAGPPAASTGANGMAVAALVLGVLAVLGLLVIVGGALFGVPAIALGLVALRRARRGAGGNVMAGFGIGLGTVGLIGTIAFVAIGISLFNSDSVQDLTSCLEQAEGQAEVDACGAQFERDLGQ